ncbi:MULTISPECIES: DUF4112 domain-containing protein [Pontibacter]|uniref:DUF4112 domain-containing protein n=1 Tax=Pontibacter lucknowensis TaxID=1077936 RepID=A0A1N7A4G5_9BACT|nr:MULTISPECIES: DUF4112 domain-containing protein [Pontibacter]EJF11013.1 hypothetical protein O71_05842 [Pontibacter sp. BAB1700]SIR33948.1 protein of unknown function [Pontibacter lucknowensis]
METANTHYTRTPRTENLKWVDRITHLMDNQFRLPGTNWRFGLDPILGLFPVVGDLASFSVSAMLILTMARYGASGKMVTLMLLNVALDALFGSIPILGNIFDFAFKANERNVRMLRAHYEEGKYQGSGKNIILGVVIGIVVIFILLIWAIWELLAFVYQLVQGWF